MTTLPTDPVAAAVLVGCAAYLMTAAGVARKKLRFRVAFCPVCHNPRTHCTCRWL